MLSNKPKILVFAGPNGSGKSTMTLGLPTIGLYVNADEIKLQTGCSDLEAAQKAESIRNILLEHKMDFTFETVLSTDRNLVFLSKAKEHGYEIHAVFVLTHDVSVNIKRVESRVEAGGHSVSKDKIISRYYRSLANISLLVRIADSVKIVDNTGSTPSLICEIQERVASIKPNEFWTEEEILRLLYHQNGL